MKAIRIPLFSGPRKEQQTGLKQPALFFAMGMMSLRTSMGAVSDFSVTAPA